MRDPIDPRTSQPQVDDKNPNPALQQRPVVGLSILIGMRPSGPCTAPLAGQPIARALACPSVMINGVTAMVSPAI